MKQVSDNISYAEATKSLAAIRKNLDNTPDEATLKKMSLTAKKVFEPVRKHFKVPIFIASFYRSKEVNAALNGAANSQHCKGEAMDQDADVLGGVTNREIFDFIRNNLEFDQLIWEFGTDEQPAWVHVSYKAIGNRFQVLRSKMVSGKTVYTAL